MQRAIYFAMCVQNLPRTLSFHEDDAVDGDSDVSGVSSRGVSPSAPNGPGRYSSLTH